MIIAIVPRFRRTAFYLLAFLASILLSVPALAQTPQSEDRRLTEIRHLDLKYSPSQYRSREEWQARAEFLRGQILAATGLLPMPEKGPLNARVLDKLDRGTYTVEKVYFESLPGFHVTGNLYRPKNATGKLPAVLCTHGHWNYGRLENSNVNSVPARAANFAMQGYVAFTYDMVGYNDSTAISHRFAPGHREGFDRETLWSVNLLGLQLWNSIRAVDFLLTLPEVDEQRISITGESGGGTQTFLLTAVDDRIKVAGPVNMISFLMQGGSLCENAPNLRIDTNNVEIGALAAPRPMIMIAATGDWTRNTAAEEYPTIQSIYRLFGAEDKLTMARMDAPHNYNQDSREAVYGWFAHWLLGRAESSPIRERGGGVTPANELLVFYGRPRPEGELNEQQLTEAMIDARRKQWREAFPRDAAGLDRYRRTFGAAFGYSLMATLPKTEELIEMEMASLPAEFAGQSGKTRGVLLSRQDKGDLVRVYLTSPQRAAKTATISLIVDPLPEAGRLDQESIQLREALSKAGHQVMVVKTFPGGRQVPPPIKFFTTYNRTDEALRVQDILTAVSYARMKFPATKINLIAPGRAGAWALLARGLAGRIDRMAIDADGFETTTDEHYVARLPIPGLRRAGDFATAVSLALLTPLIIHGAGEKFETDSIRDLYARFGQSAHFATQKEKLSIPALLAWLAAPEGKIQQD